MSVVSPGTTVGSLAVGSSAIPVATLTTLPVSASLAFTTYSVVNVLLSPGARLLTVHLSPVNSSITLTFVSVRFPSFVALMLYVIVSPVTYALPFAGVLVVLLVILRCPLATTVLDSVLPSSSTGFPSGSVPPAVATFTTLRATTSASVTL